MKKVGILGLLIIIAIALVFRVYPVSSQAQIWTGDEQGDIIAVFAPNENVYIRGSGFNTTAQINIIITRPDNLVENYFTSSDENGYFLYDYILDGMIGTYSITATDGVNSDNTTFDEPLRILEGYDGTSDNWIRGELDGWNELDWVPYRVEFAKLPTGPSNFIFNVYHNNLFGSVSGFDGLENFWVGDVNGNPVNGSVTISGPFYITPGKNCDRDIYYSLSVTFNTPYSGLNWYVYWDAHLAIGSSEWPGAKLHSYADISGSQVIPLNCPPCPSGSISGAKWNDLSYNGVWDSGEPGLSNWTIQLYFFDPVKNSWINIDNKTTGAGGCYTFSRLAAGNYRVNEVLKANWIQTYPASPGIYNITLSKGQNRNGINFGNVLATCGVNVSISPSSKSGSNGAMLTYTVTVINTGNVSDTFNLIATDNSGWSENISPTSLTLSPGGNGNGTLSVTIPLNAIGGTIDNVTVTATDNGVSASASCTGQVTINRGATVPISFSPTYENGPNGAVLTYTVTVTNTGNVSNTFSLTTTDNSGWSPTISSTSIVVPPFGSENVTLSVTIPSDAIGGTIDNISVTANGTGVSGSGSCTAQAAIARSVSVSISPGSQSGTNGGTLTYSVTITNTGNVSDTYNITVTNTAGWTENISPTSLTVPAFGSGNATLSVTIPSNAIGGTVDNITVTATDNLVSSSASCTGQVTTNYGPNIPISFSPTYENGPDGAVLVYTVTVTNTGNVSNTYSLTVTNTAGWTENISPTSLTVPAFGSGNATLSVTIPTNAIGGIIDNVTVTATGTAVSGSGSCTAQVTITRSVNVTISPTSQNGANGATLTYTITVNNTGNVSDTYSLTASNTAGWTENISPSSLTVPAFNTGSAALNVTVPPNAIGGTTYNVTITATGTGVSGLSSCTGQVITALAVNVSVLPSYQGALNGVVLNYTVTVVNLGNVTDTYNLEVIDNAGWSDIWLDDNSLLVLGFDNENTTTLHVKVPDNAIPCTKDNVVVTAISQADNTVKDNDSCIAHAAVSKGIDVVISPVLDNGLHKDVIITNTGNVIDSYVLTLGENVSWSVVLAENSVDNLMPGENRVVSLGITIPAYTTSGTLGSITVTAISKVDPEVNDNASAQVTAIKGVEVTISPTENWGSSGKRLIYTVTVKNIGNTWDNYCLNKSDVLDWMVSENFAWIPLQPGDNASVTIDVNIPENVAPYIVDNLIVTATSVTEPDINDAATSKAFGPNLVTGWNLVCFTGATGADTPSSLFPDLSYYTDYYIYYWEAPGGPYHLQGPDEVFKDNFGYWLWVKEDQAYKTTGVEPASRDISMIPGWNLVGFPITNENTTPNNIFTGLEYYTDYYIYHWTAPGGPYALQGPDEKFENYLGYWVWITQDKTVTVP